MARMVKAEKIFDSATITTAGATTSSAIDIQASEAFALHLTAIAGTSPSVVFTYSLGAGKEGPFTVPVTPVTIGTGTAADVFDFAPELGTSMKIIATNTGTGPAVVTAYLVVQEVV